MAAHCRTNKRERERERERGGGRGRGSYWIPKIRRWKTPLGTLAFIAFENLGMPI